jgi:hypothetical protein
VPSRRHARTCGGRLPGVGCMAVVDGAVGVGALGRGSQSVARGPTFGKCYSTPISCLRK